VGRHTVILGKQSLTTREDIALHINGVEELRCSRCIRRIESRDIVPLHWHSRRCVSNRNRCDSAKGDEPKVRNEWDIQLLIERSPIKSDRED